MAKVQKEIICGVYKITNLINGKFYIGSSNDIYKRWSEHKRILRKNKHINKHLQHSWNKYGENNFNFEILEECSIEVQFDKEQHYLDILKPFNDDIGYNISSKASNCVLYGEKNGWYGKGYLQNGDKNIFYGRKHTEETKRLISENHADISGENHPIAKLTKEDARNIKIDFINNKTSINELARKFNCSLNVISGVLHCKTYVKCGEEYNEKLLKIVEHKKPKQEYETMREKIIELYLNNKSIDEIFIETDAEKWYINRTIRNYKTNFEGYVKRVPLSKDEIKERDKLIIEMYLNNISQAEIVKLGYTRSVVNKTIKKYKENKIDKGDEINVTNKTTA